VAAWIVALGLLLGAMLWEDDRVRVRTGWALLLTLVPLAVAAPLRFTDDVDFAAPEMFAYLAFAGALLALAAYGWALARSAPPDPAR
jgi:hypothetical protein